MALINALAYNIAILITSVIVTASHFHPSIIFEVKARSLLGEAPRLVQKYYTKGEINDFNKYRNKSKTPASAGVLPVVTETNKLQLYVLNFLTART